MPDWLPRALEPADRTPTREIGRSALTSSACTKGSERQPVDDSTIDLCAVRHGSSPRPSRQRMGYRARRRSAHRNERRGHQPRQRMPRRLRSQVRLAGLLGGEAAPRTRRSRADEPPAHRANPPTAAAVPSRSPDVGGARWRRCFATLQNAGPRRRTPAIARAQTTKAHHGSYAPVSTSLSS
jgi:hypothetical protein